MKLLIITQKVDINDPILGFFHRWIEEFTKHGEKVTVICLQQGEYHLPAEVRVLSLGKENGQSRLKYLWNFYKYLWQERKNYDKVFVHMNPVYIILAGWWWQLANKLVFLWYTHRQVDLKLRIAEKFVNKIFTAAPESFTLVSKKVCVVGHGIDVGAFACPIRNIDNQKINLLHVGRITRIKNCDIFIEAVRLLRENYQRSVKAVFIGEAVTVDDVVYKQKLLNQINQSGLDGVVEFRGSVANREMREQYCMADLTVNLTPTGGIDKSVLESMAAGAPVLTSNQAFRYYFGEYASILLFIERDAGDLASKIAELVFNKDFQQIGIDLKKIVLGKSDVKNLIKKIIDQMQ